MASQGLKGPARDRIPFWRNVKTIGILAQVIFAVLVLVGTFVLYRNVVTTLARSNLPADFSFLDNRAGIPIAESPIPYTPDMPYWRALLIGFLNTLKVSLIGVLLASLLGVLVGVMRLSANWLLRQIATGYVELIRNTPLAVQIIFWYTAALATIPPNITNPIALPFGVYLSNRGIAFPFLYPGYYFSAWLIWLVVAVLASAAILLLRRRQIARSDQPGRAWPLALLGFLAVAGAGYFVAASETPLPENITTDFRADRGRGTVFIDTDGDGRFDRGDRAVPFAPAVVTIERGVLTDTTQNVIESRRIVPSTFRFPRLEPYEFAEAEVRFANPADAERFSVAFQRFPSVGFIYEDRNDNEEFDPGEELDPETNRGFTGVQLELVVTDFERRLVADRDAQIRIPRFVAETGGGDTEAASTPGSSPRDLFGGGARAAEAELEATITLLESGPIVVSPATIPVSNYEGGFRFTTNYLALLLALVLYTAAFIAEIVRGGIQAVSKGQTEAAKALGLSGYQTFSLIVFPQAVRIILPPMISQYLNLTKNSSLGTLAAYGELFAISAIVANQTGASVPVTVMLIASYLFISLTFAFILNIVNARMAIVER